MWCDGLNFDDWYEKYEQICEQDYLHGYCDEWVLKNFKNGDKVVAILEERENIETLCLLHTCLLRNGMFLDVRGETKNFNRNTQNSSASKQRESGGMNAL